MAMQAAQEKAHRKSHGAGIFASRKAADGEWGKKFIVVWTAGGAKRIGKTAANGSANRIGKGGTPRSRKWQRKPHKKSRVGKISESGGTSSTRKGAALRFCKW